MIKSFCFNHLQGFGKYHLHHTRRIESANTYFLQSFGEVDAFKSFAESKSVIFYLSDSTMQCDFSKIIAEHKAVDFPNR